MKIKNISTAAYEKFFERFKEIDQIPPSRWTTTHIIGYFCRKYKDYYGVDYAFDFKKSPSKSTEAYQINRLVMMLSSDGEIIKQYIDWIWENQIKQKKRRITSIGFLAMPQIVNDFKLKFLSQSSQGTNVNRATLISPKYLDLCRKFNSPISTLGELAFLRAMVDNNTIDEQGKQLFQCLIDNGFSLHILDNLK